MSILKDAQGPPVPHAHSSVDSFLLMQGELTVNAQASDKLRLTLSNNMGATLNMFATVDAIPKHLYVKVGQFRLPFGLKQRDHNILVRQGYNLGSHKRDVGVEVGGTYGKVFYNAALVNGNRSAGQAADSNQHKGWLQLPAVRLDPCEAVSPFSLIETET